MFSRQTSRLVENNKITYKTKILDFYGETFKKIFYSVNHNIKLWTDKDFSQFPYKFFIENLKKYIDVFDNNMKYIFLPFIAWKKKQNPALNLEKNGCFESLALVLKKILMI